MNKKYKIRVLQVTNATYGNLLDMSRRCIINNDYLEVVVCTDTVTNILREVAARLKAEYGANAMHNHVGIKVPFSYRQLRTEILSAFQ